MSLTYNNEQETKKVSCADFETIEISTMTIIVVTNWNLDIRKLFENLPVTEYTVVPKKRGRKRKEVKECLNEHITDASIIALMYQDSIRGVNPKAKPKVGKKKGYFRNSVTVIMNVLGKFINFKISKNGKFQITGCKSLEHAEKCIEYIWDYIQKADDKTICKIEKNDQPSAVFLITMTNIDFNIGFNINREALDEYINVKTRYNSILETSFGYTGVNIKFPLLDKDEKDSISKIVYQSGKWVNVPYSYPEYYSSLPEKECKKQTQKVRYNTFLVFHSGNVILSSKSRGCMREVYKTFVDLVQSWREIIEERVI
jgi:TATA-box binding protein (TBP) (component of TFIID and TFIIIB)